MDTKKRKLIKEALERHNYVPNEMVRGPEDNSTDMDGNVLNDNMYNIYMSLLKSGFRNIYTVIAHQTETPNPTEAACLDASRRVIFKSLEDSRGIGWRGDNKSREFYNNHG